MNPPSIITLGGVSYQVWPFNTMGELDYGFRLRSLFGPELFSMLVEYTRAAQEENNALSSSDGTELPEFTDAIDMLFMIRLKTPPGEGLSRLLKEALLQCDPLPEESSGSQTASGNAEPTPYGWRARLSHADSRHLSIRACRELIRDFLPELERYSKKKEKLDRIPIAECDPNHIPYESAPPVPIPEGWEFTAFLSGVLQSCSLSYTRCHALSVGEFFDHALMGLLLNRESRQRLPGGRLFL